MQRDTPGFLSATVCDPFEGISGLACDEGEEGACMRFALLSCVVDPVTVVIRSAQLVLFVDPAGGHAVPPAKF
ncbi:hypothetical protein DEI95_02000 [Curtobacterium sp. MCBD17_008]|nr:hypothetical protein DEI89_11180 [Curtobacterium sp. MCBD17_030]PZE95166.1 hypothetical protein DEI95_02000 [Curtobacterium sp. MCBD17_008]